MVTRSVRVKRNSLGVISDMISLSSDRPVCAGLVNQIVTGEAYTG